MCRGREPHVVELHAPDPFARLAEGERGGAVLDGEHCEIDGEQFFVRGTLELPLLDAPGALELRVWVGLSAANYVRLCEAWDREPEDARPRPAWLANTLEPAWPSALDVRAFAHPRPDGKGPLVVVHARHLLGAEQADGITVERAHEIVRALAVPHVLH